MSETCRGHLWGKIIIKLFASSWYIFLTYIYDARSHLHQIQFSLFVMDGGNEQRVAKKCCFEAGLSATETLVLVQTAYGNEALNRSNVFKWYSRFRDGRELVEDDERSGRPKSIRTEVNIAAVADLVKNDRRIASKMIAETWTSPRL